MNDLEKYFYGNSGRTIHKWNHYFEIYDRHFSKYRNKDVHIVEFGVSQGGSLRMWKDYFGAKCIVYGIDINPHCQTFEEDGVKIYIGDQSNKEFLYSILSRIPHIDILIDDGGHRMNEQIATFEILFNHVDQNGVYLCEDTHTSYWKNFGGGYKSPRSFIEYSKNFIDKIHAWHSRSRKLKVSEFTRTVKSLHYYDSILVIEKGNIQTPSHEKTGFDTIPNFSSKSHKLGIQTKFKQLIKKILR